MSLVVDLNGERCERFSLSLKHSLILRLNGFWSIQLISGDLISAVIELQIKWVIFYEEETFTKGQNFTWMLTKFNFCLFKIITE